MSTPVRGRGSPQVRFQDDASAGGTSSLFPHDEGSISLLETEAEREVHSLQKLLLETKQHLKETEHERRASLTNLHEDFPRRGSSSSSSSVSRSDSPIARRGSWLSHVSSLNEDQIEGLEKKLRSSGLETPGKGSVDAMWKDWKAASPLAGSSLRMNSPAVVDTGLPESKCTAEHGGTRVVGRKSSHAVCQDEMRRACDAMADMAKQDMLALESELLEFTRAMEYDFEQEKAAKNAEMEQMRAKFRSRLEALEGELSNARKEKEKIQTKLQEELLTATQRNGRVALELSEEIQKRKRMERELRSWKDQAATMQQALESSDVRVGALEHALAAALQRQDAEGPVVPGNRSETTFRKQDHSLSPLIVEAEGQAQWDVDQVEDGPAVEGAAAEVEQAGVGGLFPSAIDEAEQFMAMVGEEHAKELEILELQHQQALATAAEERDALFAQITSLKSQWAYQHYQAVKLRGLKEHGYGGVSNNLETMVGELAALMQELSGMAHGIADAPVVISSEKIPSGKGKDGERAVHVPLYSPSASPSGGQNPAGNPTTPCTHPDGNGADGQLGKGSERGPNNAHRHASICSFGLPEDGLDSPADAETCSAHKGGDAGGKDGATVRVSSFEQKVQTGLGLLSRQPASPSASFPSNLRPDQQPGPLSSSSSSAFHETPSKLPKQPGPPASTWSGPASTLGSPSSSPATREAEARLKELQRLAAEAMSVHAKAMAEALDLSQSVSMAEALDLSQSVSARGDSSLPSTPSLTPHKSSHAPPPPSGAPDSGAGSSERSGPRAFADPSAKAAAAARRGLFAAQAAATRGAETGGGSVEGSAGASPSASLIKPKPAHPAHPPPTSGLTVRVGGVRARIRCKGPRRSEGGPHLSVASEGVGGGPEVRRQVAQGRLTNQELVEQAGADPGRERWVEVTWEQPFEHVVYEGKQRFTMSCFEVGGEELALLGGVTVAAGKLLASAMQGEGQGDVRLALHDGNGRRVGELDVTVQICK